MHMGRTIVLLVVLVILAVYGSPVVSPVQSEHRATSAETVDIPGVGPVTFDEFREVQIRNAGILATLGTIIAPLVAAIVGNLLENIAHGITAAISVTLASGFGLIKNSTKIHTQDGVVPGPIHLQLPSLPHADVPHDNYVLPPYALNHSPLVISAGHVPPFVQLQTHAESVKPGNSGKSEAAATLVTT